MPDLEQFGKYLISEGEDLAPVILERVPDEVVCLGFNPDTDGLVEIHVVADGDDYSGPDTLSFIDRAWKAASLAGPCFQKIIDVDEFDGLAYYVTEVSDGETLEDYIDRMGPMDPSMAVAQVLELTDSIIRLQAHYQLLVGLRLSDLLVVITESAYLTLRITDLGLARREPGQGSGFNFEDTLGQLSELLVFLLTGKPYVPEKGVIESIKGLPSDLKFLLRHSLRRDSGGMPKSLEECRKTLRVCLSRLAKNISFSSNFKPLEVPKRRFPVFEIQQRLLSHIDVEAELGAGYEIQPDSEVEREPYSIPVLDRRRNRQIVLKLLPSGSILPLNHGGQVAAEMALIPPEGEVPLLRSYRFWESDGIAYITEEKINGFSLPEVLLKRDQRLEAEESMILLRSVSRAFDKAGEFGVPVRNLSTHSVLFDFPEESRFRIQDLMMRHIDHWPGFVLKLRCHASVKGVLTAPPSGCLETYRFHRKSPTPESVLAKSFIGIAEHVTVGPWPAPSPNSEAAEDERIEELRNFFRDSYAAIDRGEDFDRDGFLSALEPLLTPDHEVIDVIVDGNVALANVLNNRQTKPGIRRLTETAAALTPGDDENAEMESIGLIVDEEFAGSAGLGHPHLN